MENNGKLFDLKKDFSLWRSKRKRGTPVPRELKERACSLLEDVYRVAKAYSMRSSLATHLLSDQDVPLERV